MNVRFKKYLKRVAWGVAIVGFGAIIVNNVANGATAVVPPHTTPQVFAAAAVPAPNSITGSMVKDGTLYGADLNPAVVKWFTGTWNNTVVSDSVVDGSLQLKDFSPAAIAGLKGATGATGATGPAGAAGADAILSVSKTISLSNRDDTATDGSVWAKDTLNRSFDITRQHAAEASKCGATAVKCWYYTATIGDTGFFKTVDGAVTPNDPSKKISGIVNGTVLGVAEAEFYATSNAPDPSNVDATIAGGTSTTNMVKLFFDAGTLFGGLKLTDFNWTYDDTDPNQCNLHVQSMFSGNTGNITGTNQCTS